MADEPKTDRINPTEVAAVMLRRLSPYERRKLIASAATRMWTAQHRTHSEISKEEMTVLARVAFMQFAGDKYVLPEGLMPQFFEIADKKSF